MATITRTPWQEQVEDFIRVADANGHKCWALLSSAHPLIRGNKACQLRTVRFGVLASYRDELGNIVELRSIGGGLPVVRQRDPRRNFYGRCRGTSTGVVIRAESRAEALELLADHLRVPRKNTAYLTVSTKPTQGVVYAN